MSNIIIAFIAYLIDRIHGEFRFFRHPIEYIGDMIIWFEENYYKDSVFRGLLLVVFITGAITFISLVIEEFISHFFTLLNIVVSSLIASMFIAHKMLRDSVYEVITAENKQEAIAKIVSRDTKDMSESEIYKSAIESYAEDLSDGVIAPIFYLLIFGLPGIIVYKAINTMDSMVGYKTQKYERYGKAAALLDDAANYIPARITALLIMLMGREKNIFAFYEDGTKHDSPNAGHPITAMALVLNVQLGGKTSYFGEMQEKANFGNGRKEITQDDLKDALKTL